MTDDTMAGHLNLLSASKSEDTKVFYIEYCEVSSLDTGRKQSIANGHCGFCLLPLQLVSNRKRNLQTSKAPLGSQLQGTSLFTSAALDQRGFTKNGSWEVQFRMPEGERRQLFRWVSFRATVGRRRIEWARDKSS